MLRLWALREAWLKACWCIAQGAPITNDATGTLPSLLRHDAPRLASFGGRDDMPCSVASVAVATVTWFLGGVQRRVHRMHTPVPLVVDVAVLPDGDTAIAVSQSGVFVFYLSDGAICKKLPLEDATGVCVTPRGAVYVACKAEVFRLDGNDFAIVDALHGGIFFSILAVSCDDTTAVVLDTGYDVSALDDAVLNPLYDDGAFGYVAVFNECRFETRVALDAHPCSKPVVVPDRGGFALATFRRKWSKFLADGTILCRPGECDIRLYSLSGAGLRRVSNALPNLRDFAGVSFSESLLVFMDHALRIAAPAAPTTYQSAIAPWLDAASRAAPFKKINLDVVQQAALHRDVLHVVELHGVGRDCL